MNKQGTTRQETTPAIVKMSPEVKQAAEAVLTSLVFDHWTYSEETKTFAFYATEDETGTVKLCSLAQEGADLVIRCQGKEKMRWNALLALMSLAMNKAA